MKYDEVKALVNASDRYNNDPLHIAAMKGYLPIVRVSHGLLSWREVFSVTQIMISLYMFLILYIIYTAAWPKEEAKYFFLIHAGLIAISLHDLSSF